MRSGVCDGAAGDKPLSGRGHGKNVGGSLRNVWGLKLCSSGSCRADSLPGGALRLHWPSRELTVCRVLARRLLRCFGVKHRAVICLLDTRVTSFSHEVCTPVITVLSL